MLAGVGELISRTSITQVIMGSMDNAASLQITNDIQIHRVPSK